MFKFKKIIASVCGLAMLASTFVIASAATVTPNVSLSSGVTAAADGVQYFCIDATDFGDAMYDGKICLLLPKGVLTSETIGDNTTATSGLYFKSGLKKTVATIMCSVTPASGVDFTVDEKYDVFAVGYAGNGSAALKSDSDHILEMMVAPTTSQDIDFQIAAVASYMTCANVKSMVAENTKTYTLKAGTSTIVEKSGTPTVTTPDEAQTATKLNLDANQYTGDNATIADAFYYDAVTDEAGSAFNKVRWTVTAPSGDNPVRYIDSSITPVSGGGTVRYGLAVQGAPAGCTAKATFSVSAN